MLAFYEDEEAAAHAVAALRREGAGPVTAYSPVPPHEILEEVEEQRPSVVRRFTLVGGLIGVACGFAIGAYTGVAYTNPDVAPLVVAGRPLVAWPPYVIIMFELMVLIGGLSTFIGVLVNGRLPKATTRLEYAPEFTNDRFGVFVAGDPSRLRPILERTHPVEVREARPS
jgi:molybdopterin-containing oxidoreductase family membrane subunit